MSKDEAEKFKDEGNKAFKEKNYEEAIKQYNKAITLDPTNATYYSNRSGAWSSKGNHESALSDAERCLDKDNSFIKGYSRKGKALFDLNRWDEAETAYSEGLAVDSTNEACQRGIEDIKKARELRKQKASSKKKASSGQGIQAMGAKIFSQFGERMKKGGRMQMYLVVFAGYYLFNTYVRGNKKSSGSDDSDYGSSGADFETSGGESPQLQLGPLSRSFAEVNGNWLSYLQQGARSDATLLLLHRTSLSAEAEYGAMLPRLATLPRLRLLAPDRPCHGFSPCPAGGEPRDNAGWLSGLLAAQPAGKKLAIAATGREAASLALALARRSKAVAQIVLLDPRGAAPAPVNLTVAAEVRAWLEANSGGASTAQGAADAARWAVSDSQRAPATDLTAAKIPQGCKVTLLYGDGEVEDEELKIALEDNGATVDSRVVQEGETMAELLAEEVRQALGLPEPDE